MNDKQKFSIHNQPTVTKKDIVRKIAKKHRYPIGDVNIIVTMFCELIATELIKGKRIHIQPLGYMEHRIESERRRLNPKTKTEKIVPPRAYPKMRWALRLKNEIKNNINLKD